MFGQLINWIRLPFRKDRKSYLLYYRMLGFLPKNLRFYDEAMMHRSYEGHENGLQGQHINNERLEFLGDAILDAVVGDIVFRHFQGRREGFLTNTRSKIVQRETLNRIAVQIGLDKLVKSSGHSSAHNNYMYGNAFEALVGAIYLDYGYGKCMEFMKRRILNHYVDLERMSEEETNFKSKFIEWCQKNKLKPEFTIKKESLDKSGSPLFKSAALADGFELGEGTGYSKKESQQKAAKKALKTIQSRKRFAEHLKELKAIQIAEEASQETSIDEEARTIQIAEEAAFNQLQTEDAANNSSAENAGSIETSADSNVKEPLMEEPSTQAVMPEGSGTPEEAEGIAPKDEPNEGAEEPGPSVIEQP